MTVTRQLIGDLLLRCDQAIRLAEKRAAEHQHPHGALTARERIGEYAHDSTEGAGAVGEAEATDYLESLAD